MTGQMDLHTDELIFHMRDGILKRLQEDREFREMDKRADELAEQYPVIIELAEGQNTGQAHELTSGERAAIAEYARMKYGMHDMVELEHYVRGHRDSLLFMKRCGFLD